MIALYKGKSLMSRAIRRFTWSEYSHAAWRDDETGEVIEAWRKGVTVSPNLSAAHTPGTVVDLFSVQGEDLEHRILLRRWMKTQIGRKYDLRGALGFVLRRDGANRQDRWFCSELIAAAYAIVQLPLLMRIQPHRVSPDKLACSPRLHHVQSITTGKGDNAP